MTAYFTCHTCTVVLAAAASTQWQKLQAQQQSTGQPAVCEACERQIKDMTQLIRILEINTGAHIT